MKNYLLLILLLIALINVDAQKGNLIGVVKNEVTNETIPFAIIKMQELDKTSTSNLEGKFEINDITPGNYTIEVSSIGYQTVVEYDVSISSSRETFIEIQLKENSSELDSVVVSASPFNKTKESPVSLRTLASAEIERYPGGNRDISKVIRALPGVAQTVSFRNDIIIRGGAPNENRFYLDGIEIPNINHFATQGSSGGPVGLLNVNFIQEIDFYSGAFPANRGNALSSVFNFKQKEGNKEKLKTTFTLGSSDVGLTFDGPINEKSSFIFSARRSYLQFLFQALKLPFLPTYNDFQLNYKWKMDSKNEITFIGLGAIDEFALNTTVNEGVDDSAVIERNEYILGNIPVNNQWNYTVGLNYKHYSPKGFQNYIVSRNMLNNSAVKYFNNDDSNPNNLLLDYNSQEIENKFRYENNLYFDDWKVSFGAGYEYVKYLNSTFNKIYVATTPQTVDFNSFLDFSKFSLFGQISNSFFSERLGVSFGVRTDFNNYSSSMLNPINQLSPRLSLSYAFNENWSINANTGIYSQLPAYTIMGYRDSSNNLVNKENDLQYIQVKHIVAGVEYFRKSFKMTVEGFYKYYTNYPFLINDSISVANLGGDFGVIGNAPVSSSSEGRSYGVELLAQQKMSKGWYGILAYTYVVSEFIDKNGTYTSTAWDSRHIISLTGGKKFKRNWEVGGRFLFSGGAPFTPIDVSTSSLIPVWNTNGQGVLNYNLLNTQRLSAFHQLDVRIDKKFYFKKWALNLYLDIQNLYNFKSEQPPFLNVRRDANGNPILNPNDASRYQTYLVEDQTGTVIPTIGIILEF